jgi:hypothetical protein
MHFIAEQPVSEGGSTWQLAKVTIDQLIKILAEQSASTVLAQVTIDQFSN